MTATACTSPQEIRTPHKGMLVLGYRHLDIDFDNGPDRPSPNLAINGPIVGYSFEF